jgi:hypothetical protein
MGQILSSSLQLNTKNYVHRYIMMINLFKTVRELIRKVGGKRGNLRFIVQYITVKNETFLYLLIDR